MVGDKELVMVADNKINSGNNIASYLEIIWRCSTRETSTKTVSEVYSPCAFADSASRIRSLWPLPPHG
jgi:hypothetical protein